MQTVKIRLIKGAFLVIIAMLVMVGCSSNSKDDTGGSEEVEDGTPQQGGEATFAFEADVSNFDPVKGSSGADHSLLWPVYETLIKFTPELEPKEGLAEAWDFTDDKTLALELREGVTFHDGTPFDAEAVKFNIERINSEDSNVTDLENIESVEVVDEYNANLHLSEPDSSLLLALSDRGGMMISPTAIEESGEDFSQSPVGAGPYRMSEHIPNGEIIYERFEDYWDAEEIHLDKITAKTMADENTRINALVSGEVDYADNLNPGNLDQLENDSNIVVESETTVAFPIIYLNTSIEPLDEKAVRQAIQIGLNRDAIIEAINFGSGEPANQPFPTKYWAADDNLEIDYDPEKAKKILKEAEMEDVTFTLNHYSTAYQQRLAEAVKSQLQEVGIEVELQAMELTAAVSNYFNEKEAHALLASWTGRPDPQMTINNLFGEDSFYNTGHHSTDEIKDLISEAGSTYEQDDRTELYKKISELAVEEEAIMIPLFFEPRIVAMNESIKDFEPNLLGKAIISKTWKTE